MASVLHAKKMPSKIFFANIILLREPHDHFKFVLELLYSLLSFWPQQLNPRKWINFLYLAHDPILKVQLRIVTSISFAQTSQDVEDIHAHTFSVCHIVKLCPERAMYLNYQFNSSTGQSFWQQGSDIDKQRAIRR